MDAGGWDVIYASDVARLNVVLGQSSQQFMPTFSCNNTAMQVSFSGNFGPWMITPGGSANRINVQVPVTQGTLTAPGFVNFSLTGIQPVMNIALAFVEDDTNTSQQVVFDIRSVATSPASAADGDIYVANPDVSGLLNQRDPSGTVASMLESNLPQCFIANQAAISFVFAALFTNPQNLPWLIPKATSVAYFSSSDQSIQAIAIRTLTQSPWGPAGLSTAVDPSLLSAGQNLFYALSQGVFMKNLLLPALPSALGNGITTDVFQFNGPTQPNQQNACSITNTRPFSTQSVENAGTHYYPQINSFTMSISNNQIITTASGQFDVTGLAGAWVSFDNLQVINTITYNAATQKLQYQLLSQTAPSTTRHIPWEYWFLALGAIIGLIVIAIINIVVTVIENAVQNALSGTGNLAVVGLPASTATWAGGGSMTIAQADLESALVIRGQSA
ncbi:TULIP family P47-like protein [Fibrella aquatilis]|uniref:TULIP family P47-like protein n=1 Tax=Fibrella aquatilis TaxID=2817059 RepID=A0A939G3Q7_9BACT|nr:TULIP family P47-like protein [Fibrella aquatilis]MBO0930059.1 TULIP family P47-like protein [Fibrella aquatilis]